MSISELKRQALGHLKGKWGKSLLTVAIYMCITIILSEATSALPYWFNFVEFCVLVFFNLGLISFFLHVIDGAPDVYDLFGQSKILLKGIIVSIVQNLGLNAMSFVMLFYPLIKSSKSDALILGFAALLLILFIVGTIISFVYLLSSFILVEHPELSIAEVLKKSKKMMKGQVIKYILLFCSFIGWLIACIFTFGIGFLWLIPYVQVTLLTFYISLKKKKG